MVVQDAMEVLETGNAQFLLIYYHAMLATRLDPRRFTHLRILQQGKVHVYLVYIMLMVVLALAWASLRTWWWGKP